MYSQGWNYTGEGTSATSAADDVANIMIMSFVAYPANVELEPDIEFDITRRIADRAWSRLRSTDPFDLIDAGDLAPKDFPTKVDEANDDASSHDEDDEPVSVPDWTNPNETIGVMWVFDTPSVFAANGNETGFELVRKTLFEEYVRVGLTGFDPEGNGLLGSRVSFKQYWRSYQHLVDDPSSNFADADLNSQYNLIEKVSQPFGDNYATVYLDPPT